MQFGQKIVAFKRTHCHKEMWGHVSNSLRKTISSFVLLDIYCTLIALSRPVIKTKLVCIFSGRRGRKWRPFDQAKVSLYRHTRALNIFLLKRRIRLLFLSAHTLPWTSKAMDASGLTTCKNVSSWRQETSILSYMELNHQMTECM